jgi:hypothetical protein
MQHQQTFDELVVGESLEERASRVGVLVDDLEDPLEARSPRSTSIRSPTCRTLL